MRHREGVGQDRGLEARGADVPEETGPGLGQALVEHPLGGVESGADPDAGLRQSTLQQAQRLERDRRLVRTRVVERPPRISQERDAVVERLGALVAQ